MAGRRARTARRPPARSQHFLRTSALAVELVQDACVGPDDYVLDIGAGSGRLTAELARHAERVLAIELDAVLAERLRGRWPNVDVVQADASTITLPNEPFRVVANLPFHRTTALLRLLLDDAATPLTRADLIVEWGVAVKRGTPWPSTFNDVVWGALYEVAIARRLPRYAFSPPPTVDAGLLIFRRRSAPLVPSASLEEYRRFVARGFRRGLRSVATQQSARAIAAPASAPRDLDPYQWARLFMLEQAPPTRLPRRSSRPPRRCPG